MCAFRSHCHFLLLFIYIIFVNNFSYSLNKKFHFHDSNITHTDTRVRQNRYILTKVRLIRILKKQIHISMNLTKIRIEIQLTSDRINANADLVCVFGRRKLSFFFDLAKIQAYFSFHFIFLVKLLFSSLNFT